MPKIRNVPYRELKVGDEASIRRTCTEQELILFAHVSGNTNPLMLPDRDAATPPPVAPSMWIGSLISAVLGTRLPGPGTLYRGQTLRFGERVRPGDVLDVAVRCIEKGPEPTARFETRVAKADGTVVCEGVAEVDVPTALIETDARHLPELILDQHDHFAGLIDAARRLAPLRTAVVNPDDRASLGGALLAARNGLIQPVLVGPATAIRRAAESAELDLSPCEIVDVASPHEAARRAIELVNEGGARAVMKGNVHSDELLVQIVRKEGGLRGPRRISHAFLLDVPTLDHLLIISDAAINIAPDLVTKVDIVQNAIDLAIACGLSDPRVGILSAVETVNPNIPSTLDAAILSKMAERGQIRGGVVDGPLAMDNAIDIEAARTKGIASLVAGRADILIVPNLEAGNMLAKELTFVARAEAAGLVLGAKVPIMLTSRADNERARLASAAVAQLYDYWRREGKPFGQEPHLDAAAE
jgi:phosphotransacetylase/acyl dehydratase